MPFWNSPRVCAALLALAAISAAQAASEGVSAPASTNAPPVEVPVGEDPVFRSRMYRAMRQADQHAAEGRWKDAQDILLDLLEKAPENLLLIEKTALVLTAQERWAQALDQWNHLFAKAQSRYDVLVRIGRCQALLGRREDAERNLVLASQLSPEPLEARVWLAAVRSSEGGTNRPARAMGRLTVRETSVVAHWLSADMRFLRAVMGTPLYLEFASGVLTGRDHTVDPLGLKAMPEENWAPALSGISERLAELEQRMEAKESARADELWHDLRDRGVSGPLFEAYRAMILARTQGREAGVAVLDPLVAAHPGYVPLLHLKGVLLLETRDFPGAVPVLREAAHLSGNRTDITFCLACALAGSGQAEEAMILLNTLAAREPGRLLHMLQLEASALDDLRLRPEYSDLIDRLRAPPPAP